MNIEFELSVCNDCLIWIVNCDDSALDLLEEAEADRIRAQRDSAIEKFTEQGIYLTSSDVEEDPNFSHVRCDLCDALPGSRHSVIGFKA